MTPPTFFHTFRAQKKAEPGSAFPLRIENDLDENAVCDFLCRTAGRHTDSTEADQHHGPCCGFRNRSHGACTDLRIDRKRLLTVSEINAIGAVDVRRETAAEQEAEVETRAVLRRARNGSVIVVAGKERVIADCLAGADITDRDQCR